MILFKSFLNTKKPATALADSLNNIFILFYHNDSSNERDDKNMTIYKKVVVNDRNTDNELVFIRYSDTVDVYMTSPDKKVNDYMESNEVIQTYDLRYFKQTFPDIYKTLGGII